MNKKYKSLFGNPAIDDDGLFEVMRRSLCVDRHVNFFKWLQDYVVHYIPHDILVATWGDFSSNRLHYDVASSIPEIHAQQFSEGCHDIDILIRHLHGKWLKNDNDWFVLKGLDELFSAMESLGVFTKHLSKMESVLVYCSKDHRGNNDCLYAFFATGSQDHILDYVLRMLIPHIDSALRSVECLPPAEPETTHKPEHDISEREHEVLEWIKLGKTNYEISAILSISQNTIKNHIKSIFKKLDVGTRAQAVVKYQDIAKEGQDHARGVINHSVCNENKPS